MEPIMPNTLVLGIGNSLLRDEGVGVHLVRRLEAEAPDAGAGIRFVDGGTLSFTLAADIESAERLIVVDASQLDAVPGTVRVFVDTEMDRFVGTGKRSVHEVGLIDLLDIARLTDSLPRERALVAIQPDNLTWGCELSPAVADAVPLATEEVRRLIRNWRPQTPDAPQYGHA
jgi:hydrogenase maturation protease